ncbi:MAG TPA: ATP-binding protein [Thermoanaerobaculia bacterium]
MRPLGRILPREGAIVSQAIYEARQNVRFVPVVFDAADEAHIPVFLKSATSYNVSDDAGYESLLRRLTGQPKVVKGPLGPRPSLPPRKPVDRASREPNVAISRLPVTGEYFVGRDDELTRLHAAWDDPSTHVISFVAFGGVGKSSLVNRWLDRLAADGWRGAERVLGWSFYSQGTDATGASGDAFVEFALGWLGYDGEPIKSAWEKGVELARLVRGARTLLVLDGLEPLQHPPGSQEGRVKDPAVAAHVGSGKWRTWEAVLPRVDTLGYPIPPLRGSGARRAACGSPGCEPWAASVRPQPSSGISASTSFASRISDSCQPR